MLINYAITVLGSRHESKGKDCQDASIVGKLLMNDENIFSIGVLADGVGVCRYSGQGASIAVRKSFDTIKNEIMERMNRETDWKKEGCEILRTAFEQAYDSVKKTAQLKGIPLPLMDTTLLAYIYDGKRLWVGNIGDSGAIVLYTDGYYELVTKRHKGDDMDVTFVQPLRDKECWEFKALDRDVAAICGMTDGLLDCMVDDEAMGNRVYWPGVEQWMTDLSDTEEKEQQEHDEWKEYMEKDEEFRNKVTDDITLVVSKNSELLRKMETICFDQEKWDRDTKNRDMSIMQALYKSYSIEGCSLDENEKKKKLAVYSKMGHDEENT